MAYSNHIPTVQEEYVWNILWNILWDIIPYQDTLGYVLDMLQNINIPIGYDGISLEYGKNIFRTMHKISSYSGYPIRILLRIAYSRALLTHIPNIPRGIRRTSFSQEYFESIPIVSQAYPKHIPSISHVRVWNMQSLIVFQEYSKSIPKIFLQYPVTADQRMLRTCLGYA